MIKFFSLILLVATVMLGACKDLQGEFSGIEGRVALGPVSGAEVKIYDASTFVSLDSDTGLIAATESGEGGAFRIAIDDEHIGRPLIMVASFPADEAGTPGDERAEMTLQSGGTERLEPENGPWVAMIDFFDGLTVHASISPITTLAWESLRNAPASIVGGGNNRFTDQNIRVTNFSVANAFGLRFDPAEVLIDDENQEADNYRPANTAQNRYLLEQFENAGRAFAAATTDAADSYQDFIVALRRDLADGVFDGRSHGLTDRYLSSIGAPDVIGFEADGSSKILSYFVNSTAAPSDASLVELRERQALSLGSGGLPRIDRVSQSRILDTSSVEIEVFGAGFSHDSELVYGAVETNRLLPEGQTFTVDGTDVDRGQILEIRQDYLRFRTPVRASIPSEYRPNASDPVRGFNIFLRRDFAPSSDNQSLTLYRLVESFDFVHASGAVLLESSLLRIGNENQAATLLVGGLSVAPNTLDPMADDVYALEMIIGNGGDTSLSGVTLSLDDCVATTTAGTSLAVGDIGSNADLVFDSQAMLDATGLTLAPDESKRLLLRFGRNSTAPDLVVSDVVNFSPVLRSNEDGIGDAASPEAGTTLLFADGTSNPMPQTASISNGTALNMGESSDLVWTIDRLAVAAPSPRSFNFDRLELALDVDGTEVVLQSFKAPNGDWTFQGDGFRLSNFRAIGLDGASANQEVRFEFTLEHQGSAPAALTFTLDAQWLEEASGLSGMLQDSINVTLN